MPFVVHSTRQYENNRAEVSHQPTRQRERRCAASSRRRICNASRRDGRRPILRRHRAISGEEGASPGLYRRLGPLQSGGSARRGDPRRVRKSCRPSAKRHSGNWSCVQHGGRGEGGGRDVTGPAVWPPASALGALGVPHAASPRALRTRRPGGFGLSRGLSQFVRSGLQPHGTPAHGPARSLRPKRQYTKYGRLHYRLRR